MSKDRDLSTMTLNEFVASVEANEIDVTARVDVETGEIALLICGKGEGAALLFSVLSTVIDLSSVMDEPETVQA